MLELELSRRRILQLAAAAAAATVLPLARPDEAAAILSTRDTFDAFADTIVPGEPRFAGDKVVLGATSGPGAVQAGSWQMFTDPDVGLAALLPALAVVLDTTAVAFAATSGGLLKRGGGPTFVGLDFNRRTGVVRKLVESKGPDQILWYAMAAMPMLAFHTAGFLDTATAVRQGHPGLAWLGFPDPDDDGIWRFPDFSYRRELATSHPQTTANGQPA